MTYAVEIRAVHAYCVKRVSIHACRINLFLHNTHCVAMRAARAAATRGQQEEPGRRESAPRDRAAGIRAAPEGRRSKEAAAARPAATRQGTVIGWPPRRCGKMAKPSSVILFYF